MTEWPYHDRSPHAAMEAREVVRIMMRLEAARVDAWLDGGWGVDALLETQMREHDDLDLVISIDDAPVFITVAESLGYTLVARGPHPSFVLVDTAGRQVDVHPVSFRADRGGGVYLMDTGDEWIYPSSGFAGRGTVEGYPVRCLSPEVQVLVHDGYQQTEKDYRELELLHEHFGVAIPHLRQDPAAEPRTA
jgi:lincosamide nucleotidyltransferase A/C/D/E